MNKHCFELNHNDRNELEALLKKGTLHVKQFKRATALLELDRGKTLHEVAATVQVTSVTVAA